MTPDWTPMETKENAPSFRNWLRELWRRIRPFIVPEKSRPGGSWDQGFW